MTPKYFLNRRYPYSIVLFRILQQITQHSQQVYYSIVLFVILEQIVNICVNNAIN